MTEPLIEIKNLQTHFFTDEGIVKAVENVSLTIPKGKTIGLVGESGCGKSTTAKAVIQIPTPTSGHVYYNGTDLAALRGEDMRRMRPEVQMIFQDPISSLNPRRKVRDIVSEGVRVWGSSKAAAGSFTQDRINELIEAVGLDPVAAGERRPHEFSGGQCQRISVARALVLDPKIVICDEPVSALDVSIQAQVLNLLADLQDELGLTYLFIAHDLSVVRHISDRVAVMYLGKLVEVADRDDMYGRPMHPYSHALLSAVPIPDPELELKRKRILLEGDIPSPANPPAACRFHTRCPKFVEGHCDTEEPLLRELEPGHWAACHYPEVRELF